MNHTHLSCITPPLPVQSMVVYTLNLDNAPPPDFSVPNLQLSVRPDPTGFGHKVCAQRLKFNTCAN